MRAVLYGIVSCVLLCALLVTAATRTEVGRDALGEQIESWYARTYHGSLSVGALRGNLLNQVFLSDVQVFDEWGQGGLVIDSVAIKPRWYSLFTGKWEARSALFVGPVFTLHAHPDSAGQFAPLMRRRGETQESDWALEPLSLDVRNGEIHVQASHIETGWLASLLAPGLVDIHVEAQLLGEDSYLQMAVLSLQGSLAGTDLDLTGGQFLVAGNSDSLSVDRIGLQLGRSRVQQGQLSWVAATESKAAVWQASLEQGELHFGELRQWIPQLPLDAAARMSYDLHGTSEGVAIRRASIGVGSSAISLSGMVDTAPDSTTFALAIAPSPVAPADLVALGSPLPEWLISTGKWSIQGSAAGAYRPDALRIGLEASTLAQEGSMQVAALLEHTTQEGWTYNASADMDAVTVPEFGSTLSGKVELRGAGYATPSLEVTGALEQSIIAGNFVEEAELESTIADQRIALTANARSGDESIALQGTGAWHEAHPEYTAEIRTSNLNLGPLLRLDSVTTALTSVVNLEGSGASWDALQGTLNVRVDSARVQSSGNLAQLPEHELSATLNPLASTLPRLVLGGGVLSGTVEGNTDAAALTSVTRLWASAVRDAVQNQQAKTLARASLGVQLPPLPWPSLDLILQQGQARTDLQSAGLSQIALNVAFQVHESAWLTAWLQLLDPAITQWIAANAGPAPSMQVSLQADENAARLQGHSMLSAGGRITAEITTTLDRPIEQAIVADISVERLGTPSWATSVVDPWASVVVENGVAHVSVQTAAGDRIGPLSIEATVDLLPDRFLIDFTSGSIAIAGRPWQLRLGRTAEVFADALVLNQFSLTRADTSPQHIRARGVVSRNPASTISVDFAALRLQGILQSLGEEPNFSGTANGTVQWSRGAGLVGRVSVDTLAYMSRILGFLDAQSHLVPGGGEVSVDVQLHPFFVGDGGVATGRNDLTITGMMTPGSGIEPGSLDLSLEVERLDASILEELIPDLGDVQGGFTGGGTITGTPGYPLLDVDLVSSGFEFGIPEHDVHYEAEATLHIDSIGLHVERMAITDRTGGTVDIAGTMLFNQYRYFSFDAAATFDELQIMNVPTYTRALPWYGTVWVTGDVALTGPIDQAHLRSDRLVVSPEGEIQIPIRDAAAVVDPGFIIYQEPGESPEEALAVPRRANILERRPETEREFGMGLEIDLNIEAPQGSTIKLVIDPLLGDVITGNGSARVQLQRHEGDFTTFGSFDVTSGDYLFTAGEVFVRRFLIQDGTITWTGDPLDPVLDINAEYRTRASRGGLPEDVGGTLTSSLPLIVALHVTGRLNAVLVGLDLVLDQRQEVISDTPLLEAYLNQPDRAAQHATSVLLTNSFLLSTEGAGNTVLAGSALNSVSQLVTSQLNRYLSQVIPNADFALGVLSDETAQELDVSAGVALRLLDERLLIRGQGIYRGQQTDFAEAQGLEGEFVVELRLSPSVSLDLFYRREGDVLSEALFSSERGVGLNYRTQFATWRELWDSLKRKPSASADASADSTQE